MFSSIRPLARLTAVAASLIACGTAAGQGLVQRSLLNEMSAKPATPQLVLVSFKQRGPVTATQLEALKAIGIRNGVHMRRMPIVAVAATPEMIRKIAQRPDVLSVFRNAPLRYFNKDATALTGSNKVFSSGAPFGRPTPFSGRGTTVAVIDSGVDATNPDLPLGSKLVDNVQAVPAALLTLVNSLGQVALEGPGIVPVPFLQNQPNTDLSSGHGTHVAGTVAGTGGQSRGEHRGSGPGADILGYGTGAAISILNAVVGMDYALANKLTYRNPIRVTSNSYGSAADAFTDDELCTTPITVASYELYKNDIITVFAAGNDGPGENTHNPYGRIPWVISVAAGEKDGVLTDFSSRGRATYSFKCKTADGVEHTFKDEPTITGPGTAIVSTRAYTGAIPLLSAPDDIALPPAYIPFYTTLSGTSMATPHVSGLIAMILEANPSLTPDQVREVLRKTASNMTNRASWEVGAGYVNVYAAVALAQSMAKGAPLAFGSTVNNLKQSQFAQKGVIDIANHPAKAQIETALARRLVDVYSDGQFLPDGMLNRGDLAQYLVSAGTLRQSLPFGDRVTRTSGSDVPAPTATNNLFPYAEIVTAKGSVVRDLTHSLNPVLPNKNGAFNALGAVSRAELAYSLVQSLGLQAPAAGQTTPVTFTANGSTYTVEDAANLSAIDKWYVQQALNIGMFSVTYKLANENSPTVVALFRPADAAKRFEYASAALTFQTRWQAAQDGR